MSHLRRSRPDEQDASLKRLQEISKKKTDPTSLFSPNKIQLKDSDDEDNSLQQLSKSDKWNKLRSILLAMRDEPVNDECQQESPEVFENHHDHPRKLNIEDDLQLELLALQRVLKKKTLQLQLAEEERDSALSYICHLKASQKEQLPSPESNNGNLKLYKYGVDSLRDTSVSKESVIALLSPMMEELHRQKSYLDRLMTITLMRAPWILDEVDKIEMSNCEQNLFRMDGDEEGR